MKIYDVHNSYKSTVEDSELLVKRSNPMDNKFNNNLYVNQQVILDRYKYIRKMGTKKLINYDNNLEYSFQLVHCERNIFYDPESNNSFGSKQTDINNIKKIINLITQNKKNDHMMKLDIDYNNITDILEYDIRFINKNIELLLDNNQIMKKASQANRQLNKINKITKDYNDNKLLKEDNKTNINLINLIIKSYTAYNKRLYIKNLYIKQKKMSNKTINIIEQFSEINGPIAAIENKIHINNQQIYRFNNQNNSDKIFKIIKKNTILIKKLIQMLDKKQNQFILIKKYIKSLKHIYQKKTVMHNKIQEITDEIQFAGLNNTRHQEKINLIKKMIKGKDKIHTILRKIVKQINKKVY